MSLKQVLQEYLEGKKTAIEAIRIMSGVFDPKNAVDLLVLVNAIARIEDGDMDKETFKEVWKLK